MYELPDLLAVARQMNDALREKKIVASQFNEKGYYNLPKKAFETALIGKTIGPATGQGKWLLVKLEPDMYLQLGFHTGHILYHANQETIPKKFTSRVDFADNTVLTIRNYGMSFIRVLTEDELIQVTSSKHPGKDTFKYPGRLGISPVDEKEFTFKAFNNILEESSTKMIKDILTVDQTRIAGIGNGYFQEMIFKAKIHPKKRAGELSQQERKALYNAIREILSEAIRLGGKDDVLDLYGKKGGYRKILGAHALGKPCPDCGTAIEKLNLLGSTTYYCPSCQKMVLE